MQFFDQPQFFNALLISAAASGTLVSLVAFIMYLLLKNKTNSLYNDAIQKVALSEMRSSYESKMAQLALEMNSTEKRWRDSQSLVLSGQEISTKKRNDPISINTFLRRAGVTEADLVRDPNLVLFLTPFTDEEFPIYIMMQSICADLGLNCIRGDESRAPGDVLSHVIKLITKATIIIANIGTRNANVFYELGIAQALGKETILISRTLEEIPFDVKNHRVILYKKPSDLQIYIPRAISQMIADART